MAGSRYVRAWAAALAGLTALGACSGARDDPAPEVAAVTGTPGEPGIGDPYFPLDGNGGYDVRRYELDLRYDPAADRLGGVATVHATATQDLSAFSLDLEGLEVESVTVDRRRAAFDRDGGELTVTPARPLAEGTDFAAAVAYAGVPGTLTGPLGTSGFFHTSDGALVAGQPDAAATWFPADDHPRDAAAVDVSVTVPEGLEAVSNGALVGTDTEAGWTTWRWSAAEPMAPYLVTIAVGEFELREYEADGIRYWDAIDPALYRQPAGGGRSVGELAGEALARQPEVLEVLSGFFGPYPFGEAGGIVDDVPELGFALEDQTRPVYGPVFFTDPVPAGAVVAHELAHQWAGDSVRLAGWQHIWLNEGFATYAEWIWAEHEGRTGPQQRFDRLAARPAGDGFWTQAIGDPGPGTDTLFSAAVYQRGAMTLHALRTEVGDAAFAEIVETWFTDRSGQAVTTDDFVALAEEVSGRELDGLFAEWLGPGRPAGLG